MQVAVNPNAIAAKFPVVQEATLFALLPLLFDF